MAIAETLLEVEPTDLGWLNIKDNDGKIWRYVKRGNADVDAAVHVAGEIYGNGLRAALVRDVNGIAILRRPEPGLPKMIVVHHVALNPPGPYAAITFWSGKLEYEQESAT